MDIAQLVELPEGHVGRTANNIKQLLNLHGLQEKHLELRSKENCQSLVRILNRMLRDYALRQEIQTTSLPYPNAVAGEGSACSK